LRKAGLVERDRMVFTACAQLGLPVAITMSGGYAKDADDIADIHFQTIRLALEFSKNGTVPST
jgi:hypothetical protein